MSATPAATLARQCPARPFSEAPPAPRLRPAPEPEGLPPLPPFELGPPELDLLDAEEAAVFALEIRVLELRLDDTAGPSMPKMPGQLKPTQLFAQLACKEEVVLPPPCAPALRPAASPFEPEDVPELDLPPAAVGDGLPPWQAVPDDSGEDGALARPPGASDDDGEVAVFSLGGWSSLENSDEEESTAKLESAGRPTRRRRFSTCTTSSSWSLQDFQVSTGKCILGPGGVCGKHTWCSRASSPTPCGGSGLSSSDCSTRTATSLSFGSPGGQELAISFSGSV